MIATLLLAAALAAAPAPKAAPAAASTPEAQLDKAQAKMKSLDFDVAKTLLEQLLARPDLAPALKANALVSLGITRFNLGQAAEARQAFDQALAADPTVALPKRVAPKIAEVFAQAQAARAAATAPPQPPPPVEVKPEPKPVEVKPEPKPVEAKPATTTVNPFEPKPQPTPPVVAVAPVQPGAEPAPVEVKQGAAGYSLTWPVVVGVVALAGIGVGVGAAVGSSDAGRELRTGLHSAADADSILSRQRTLSTTSIVGYAAGGVAAALAVTLLSGEIAGHWFSGSAAVTPAGASVALSTNF